MPHYATWERAPYHPYECVICTHEASAENPLVDAGRVIEDYGDVYVCKSCITSLAYYLKIVQDAQDAMQVELDKLNSELAKVPHLIERLVNGIRDISISTSADLLAIGSVNLLVNDENVEQVNSSVNENKLGDDSVVESGSEPTVDEGSDSVPADSSSKRTANPAARKSPPSNR